MNLFKVPRSLRSLSLMYLALTHIHYYKIELSWPPIHLNTIQSPGQSKQLYKHREKLTLTIVKTTAIDNQDLSQTVPISDFQAKNKTFSSHTF